MNGIGRRMREVRELRRMSQRDVALRAEISKAAIQKIESGDSLRPRNIDALAFALTVPSEWLLCGVIGRDKSATDALRVGFIAREL